MEDQEESKKREEEWEKEEEQRTIELAREQLKWEQEKTSERDIERRKIATNIGSKEEQPRSKRRNKGQGSRRRRKKLKYEVLGEDWGAAPIQCEELIQEDGEEKGAAPTPTEEQMEQGGTDNGAVTREQATTALPSIAGAVTMEQTTTALLPTAGWVETETMGLTPTKALTQSRITLFLVPTTPTEKEGCDSFGEGGTKIENDSTGCNEVYNTPVEDSTTLRMNEDSCNENEDVMMKMNSTPSVNLNWNVSNEKASNDDLRTTSNEIVLKKNVTCDGNDCATTSTSVGIDENVHQNGGAFKTDENKSEGGGNIQISCTFKRGVCQKHKLKGERKVVTSKKRAQKKFGFGFVTSKKTIYTCLAGLGLTRLPATDSAIPDGSQSPVQANQVGSETFENSFYKRSEDNQSEVAERTQVPY